MRLLIFTQKVDSNDSILGFFCAWIKEFAKNNESVSVICLEKGVFDLPKNVTVYSLGKESGVSWFRYILNFYKHLFLMRGSYDKIFVHMNQEYVLLGGLYWKIIGIPVYMWRNHPVGNFLTYMTVFLSTKVFCTSTQSFTAQFKKTVIMPVGVNTNKFKQVIGITRKKYSVCMVSRISPIKKIELALSAVGGLVLSGTQISMTIIGSPSISDFGYYNFLKKQIIELNLSTYVSFISEVAQDKLPEIYSGHELYLNLTPSGSFDKTIIEATSCGAIPLVSNSSLEGLLPEICITDATPEAISNSIQRLFDPHEQLQIQDKLMTFVESGSLETLMKRLSYEL